MTNAVVLLSGGLDSATTLAIAQEAGFHCHTLTVAYGQRHAAEINAAAAFAEHRGVASHRVIEVDLRKIGGSALTADDIAVPESPSTGIPVTYVPARNTLFLALALGLAETLPSTDLFIGVNAVDYSGYPDCRPQFIRAFETLAQVATKAGVEGAHFSVHAPLLDLRKEDIIRKGIDLGVDFSVTVSCYQADQSGRACGRCDACEIRRAGFLAAGIADPTRYRSG